MQKDNDKLLIKIKKLLNLSKSSNPHEAAKALELAQKLMMENNINMIDVEISEKHSNKKFAMNAAPYVYELAGLISKAFGVKAYVSNSIEGCEWGDRQTHFVFFGKEEHPLIATYCFEVLYRQVTNARKSFNESQSSRLKRSTRIARADKFCSGWVRGVYQNIKEFALTKEDEIKLEKYNERLAEKNRETWGNVNPRDVKNTRDSDKSMCEGFNEGRKVKLNHGVNGKETLKISY